MNETAGTKWKWNVCIFRKYWINQTRHVFFSAQLMGGGVFVVFLWLAVRLELRHFLFGFIQTRQDMCSALPIG